MLCPFWRETYLCVLLNRCIQTFRSQMLWKPINLSASTAGAREGRNSARTTLILLCPTSAWVSAWYDVFVHSCGRSKELPLGFFRENNRVHKASVISGCHFHVQLPLKCFDFHKMEFCLSRTDQWLDNSCGGIMVPGVKKKSPFSLQLP